MKNKYSTSIRIIANIATIVALIVAVTALIISIIVLDYTKSESEPNVVLRSPLGCHNFELGLFYGAGKIELYNAGSLITNYTIELEIEGESRCRLTTKESYERYNAFFLKLLEDEDYDFIESIISTLDETCFITGVLPGHQSDEIYFLTASLSDNEKNLDNINISYSFIKSNGEIIRKNILSCSLECYKGFKTKKVGFCSATARPNFS